MEKKYKAAATAIVGGALLVLIEVMGGLISGSLGLISSALNTIVNFLASIIIFLAIRESGKKPDETHMYGHEKIESIAGIAEVLLLIFVCLWILYSAISDLIGGGRIIHSFFIAVGINFVSISINLIVYRKLSSSSKELGSESMEAGALHFMNDLLIAFVVILGLVLYRFGFWYADSVAAIIVVFFTLYSSLSVIKKTFSTLLDVAPSGVVERLKEEVLNIAGVKSCHKIRVRRAGSKNFVDAHVEIEGHISLDEAHMIASKIEEQIVKVLPNTDVLIHTEPYSREEPISVIRNAAFNFPAIMGIHRISLKKVGEDMQVSYHIEFEPGIAVREAHEISNLFEEEIESSLPENLTIISHLEPATRQIDSLSYGMDDSNDLREGIYKIVKGFPEIRSTHRIHVLTLKGKQIVTLHCTVQDSISLDEAHSIITKIEEKIKEVNDSIEEVTIHCEPE